MIPHFNLGYLPRVRDGLYGWRFRGWGNLNGGSCAMSTWWFPPRHPVTRDTV